jgi:hypothetical protein
MWHFKVTIGWKFSITYNDSHRNLKHGLFKVYVWEPLMKVKKPSDPEPQDIITIDI